MEILDLNKELEESTASETNLSKKELKKLKKKEKKLAKKRRPLPVKIRAHLTRIMILLMLVKGAHLFVVYTDNEFIAKWRTLYIETAMTTHSHQWLATFFFPQSMIDDIMDKLAAELEAQKKLNSVWENTETETEPEDTEKEDFYAKYWELDSDSVHEYLDEDAKTNGYEKILVEDFDKELGLKTSCGDDVLVIDTENNLLIVGVSGANYVGKLAIVKNAEQVDLVKSANLGSSGQEVATLGANNNAVVAINASGFKDVGGHGSGGTVKGSLVIDGVDYGNPDWVQFKFFGYKDDNRLYITNYSPDIVKDYKWAIQFYPALVINGESVVDGSFGMGIQPRSTIAQTENGDFMMLIVDGRQVGYSLGCTVKECTDVMMRYKAYQGMNLDGGSSSVMYYKGNLITKSSSVSGRGRYCPDALIIRPSSDVSK